MQKQQQQQQHLLAAYPKARVALQAPSFKCCNIEPK
jgi:hypothetical protein